MRVHIIIDIPDWEYQWHPSLVGGDPAADTGSKGLAGQRYAQPARWSEFAPAIVQWERILGRPAPEPTVRRVDDGPARRVCDRLSRTQQLKILGNGVVPQQAALAWKLLAP